MWLCDLLPPKISDARIMTFGYTSGLRDDDNAALRLEDYADSLSRQLGRLRSSTQTTSRPLILVCHSMGGLVSRLAMTRLFSAEAGSIRTDQCGLLFLSTPHQGSPIADWDRYFHLIGKMAGMRDDLIKQLRTFNTYTTNVEQVWSKWTNERPEIACFVESSKQKIKLGQHVMVRNLCSLDTTFAYTYRLSLSLTLSSSINQP